MELQDKQLTDEIDKIYYIHDNGGRPFRVDISNNTVKIYEQIDCDSDSEINNNNGIMYNTEPSHTFQPIKIFIGKSPRDEITKYDKAYGPKFDGNTILLQIDNNEYVFIGSEINSYNTLGEITEFFSPVGSNDVPYPYAIDDGGNIYLFIENVIIKNSEKLNDQMKNYDNPYNYYYDYNLITADIRGGRKPKPPKIEYFNNIDKYFIGDEQYVLNYFPFPSKDYDRLTEDEEFQDDQIMYVVDKDGTKRKLDKDSYINLMESFGKVMGFEPLPAKFMHQERDIRGSFMGRYLAVINS